MPSESDIPIHTFSNFTSLTICLSSLDLSVSEYQTYNICNFATTYDRQTAEKVCPTYPPIYRYGATPPSNLQWMQIRDFQTWTRTRNPGLTFPKPENPGLQKEPGFGNSNCDAD